MQNQNMFVKRANANLDDCQSSKRRRQCKTRKSVRWASSAPVVHEVPNTSCDYKNDVWYSRAEFDILLLERSLNVQCLRQVAAGDRTPLNPDLVCFRGLEPFRSDRVRKAIVVERKNHVKRIIEEQRLQALFCVREPERFRLSVESSSLQALRVAQNLAALDQQELYPTKSFLSQAISKPLYSVDASLEQMLLSPQCINPIAVRAA